MEQSELDWIEWRGDDREWNGDVNEMSCLICVDEKGVVREGTSNGEE
jgi:hypothetical protein